MLRFVLRDEGLHGQIETLLQRPVQFSDVNMQSHLQRQIWPAVISIEAEMDLIAKEASSSNTRKDVILCRLAFKPISGFDGGVGSQATLL